MYFEFETGKGLPNHIHNGYASMYVISVNVEIEFNSGEKFTLSSGDFLPFDASVEHDVIAKKLVKYLL